MSFRYPAGVVGATVTPSGPYQNSTASGAWSLAAQANFKSQSLWPTAGNAAPNLYSFGVNDYGQLGLGNTTAYSSPKQAGSASNWYSVSPNYGRNTYFSALKTDGTLWSWGRNDQGQLGLGNTTNYSSFKQIGALTDWLTIANGYLSIFAIKTNNTLWAWGYNSFGNLGLGNTTSYSSPKQVGSLTNWSNISAGFRATLAVKTDGTLWSWGSNYFGSLGIGNTVDKSSPVQVGSLTNWLKVSCGYGSSFAIKTDGTLWAWGENIAGQLGLNNTTYSFSSPQQVGALTNWSSISTGTYGRRGFSLAVKTDGTLWSWGRNDTGALGLGNTTNYSSPKQVGALTTWLKVSAGYASSFSIKTNGTFWSWGYNTSGQLGLNNKTNYSSPKQIGSLTNWSSVSAASDCSIALIS